MGLNFNLELATPASLAVGRKKIKGMRREKKAVKEKAKEEEVKTALLLTNWMQEFLDQTD